MPYSIRTVQAAVVSILDNVRTTDLSAGLTATGIVTQVVKGTPDNAPRTISQLPVVWVQLDGDQEDFAEMGPGARRNITCRFKVTCAAKAFPAQGNDVAEEAAAILMDNVSGIIRANPSLSQTVAWIKPTGAEYNQPFGAGGDGAYVSAGVVSLEAFLIST